MQNRILHKCYEVKVMAISSRLTINTYSSVIIITNGSVSKQLWGVLVSTDGATMEEQLT